MIRTMMNSKIHRARVTESNLNYVGSITIDSNILDAVDILPNEKVAIVNNNNGARFETYVIAGERGSGKICLNGAASRLVEVGDIVIIMTYAQLNEKEVKNQLFKLNGNRFKFDSTIINLFKKKCFLTGKLPSNTKDKTRLSKIHGIASGCENVYQINDSGEFLFINSLENVDRAKRILEKFHYCLSQTIYKYQPISNVKTNDRLTEICQDFIKSVRNLPKVLSVTHNLQLNTDDVNKII